MCLLLSFLLLAPVAAVACSWDYTIWMIRSKTADPLYRFIQNGKAGYIDRSGKIVVQPKFKFYGNYDGEFHDGLLHLGLTESQYADMTGKIVLDNGYYRAWDFSDGLAIAMKKDGEKWGYIDRTGEFAISPRFDGYPNGYVYPFSEGLAMIDVGKEYGYIDHSGKFVIQPKLLFGTEFKDGMARVVVEGPCSYFKADPCPDLRILGKITGEQVQACKFTFIDKTGSIISKERYDNAKDFGEGLAPVLKGEKWGYIDKKGLMVIEPKFDDAEPFSDGFARIKQGELYGYINHAGAIIIPPQFDYAEDFSDGLAVVGDWNEKESRHYQYYYINKQGTQAILEKFALASHFFKGIAHVKLKSNKKRDSDDEDSGETGEFAYINLTGRKIFRYENRPEN